jgi:PIN domain nuclease of toxin-antitoxin system
MSTLLLDTHTFLWAVNAPDHLGSAARTALEELENEVFVSAASAWEVATKHRLGKLPEADRWLPAWEAHVARLGARSLPVTSRHALVAGGLEWSHRDPFDRMLAAQAVVEDHVLVTRDAAFHAMPVQEGLRALALLW